MFCEEMLFYDTNTFSLKLFLEYTTSVMLLPSVASAVFKIMELLQSLLSGYFACFETEQRAQMCAHTIAPS